MLPVYVCYLIYGAVILFLSVAVWYSRKNSGMAAPSTFVLVYTLATMVVYFINSKVNLPEERWFAGYDFVNGTIPVALISVFAASSALIATFYAGASRQKDTSTEFAIPNIPIWADSLGLIMALLVLFLYLWHFSCSDFANAMTYSDYIYSRTTEFYKITDPVATVAHIIRKPVGLLLSAVVPFLWISRRYFQVAILSVPLVYLFALNLVEHSKYCLVYLVIMGLILSLPKTQKASYFTFGVAGLLGIMIFGLTMLVRHERSYGLNSIIYVLGDLRNRGPELGLVSTQTFHLLFGGGRIFEESLNVPFNPSSGYKITSFSPLISAIDGFDKTWRPGPDMAIRYWDSPHGAIWAPLSGLAQLYHFGPMYMAGFWVFLTISLCYLQKAWVANRGILTSVAMSPFYLFVPMLFSYPMRNCFRLLLIAMVFVTVARRFEKRNEDFDDAEDDSEDDYEHEEEPRVA